MNLKLQKTSSMSLSVCVSHYIEQRVLPIQEKLAKFNWKKLTDSIRLKLTGYTNENDIQPLLEEFQKFLFIKIIDEDLDASSYSPSYLIDQVWHRFLLLPKDYYNFCAELLGEGRILDHNPLGGDNSLRYKNTRRRYKQLFGREPPLPYWESSRDEVHTSSLSEENASGSPLTSSSRKRARSPISNPTAPITMTTTTTAPSSSHSPPSNTAAAAAVSTVTPPDALLEVKVVMVHSGDVMLFRARLDTTIRTLQNAAWERYGFAPHHYYWLYDGVRIYDEATFRSIGFENGDQIDLIAPHSSC